MYPLGVKVVTFRVEGDWKHDHLYFEDLVEKWAKENGKEIWKIDENIVEEDGSDYYTADHKVYITDKETSDRLNSMRGLFAPKEESLKEGHYGQITLDVAKKMDNGDYMAVYKWPSGRNSFGLAAYIYAIYESIKNDLGADKCNPYYAQNSSMYIDYLIDNYSKESVNKAVAEFKKYGVELKPTVKSSWYDKTGVSQYFRIINVDENKLLNSTLNNYSVIKSKEEVEKYLNQYFKDLPAIKAAEDAEWVAKQAQSSTDETKAESLKESKKLNERISAQSSVLAFIKDAFDIDENDIKNALRDQFGCKQSFINYGNSNMWITAYTDKKNAAKLRGFALSRGADVKLQLSHNANQKNAALNEDLYEVTINFPMAHVALYAMSVCEESGLDFRDIQKTYDALVRFFYDLKIPVMDMDESLKESAGINYGYGIRETEKIITQIFNEFGWTLKDIEFWPNGPSAIGTRPEGKILPKEKKEIRTKYLDRFNELYHGDYLTKCTYIVTYNYNDEFCIPIKFSIDDSKSEKDESLKENLMSNSWGSDFGSDVYNALGEIAFKYYKKDINITEDDWAEAIEWFMTHFFEDEQIYEESLKEDLMGTAWGSNFKSDVYNALSKIAFKYYRKNINVTDDDWDEAIEWFMTHFFESDDNPFDESLHEGRKIDFDDDIVKVYDGKKVIYHGLEDYEPMNNEPWV